MFKVPLKDMAFNVEHVADLASIASLPGLSEAGIDTANAVLEESARFNEEVLAPLNRTGDKHPPVLDNGVVTTSPGFKEAFEQFAAGGWQGIQHPERFGGAGLPKLIATPCIEMINSANLAFALCPLLTDGAIEALLTAGSDEMLEKYLPNLVSGKWTGTMNLTEPQAGSDLSLVRAKAEPQPDGTYRISGQKIFITFGEHDMAENICHLVLARVPGAPEGVKGISLFLVPKFLVNEDGSPGKRNDVWCQSIEHKLGLHGSPTAVLLFGDDKGEVGAGAVGTLVGEENRGLQTMFIMMNAARFAVGMQGIAVAERAYQQALAYAKDRVQSRDVGGSSGPVTIVNHPDVRRMLMTIKAMTEGARALAYYAAAAHDHAHHNPDPETAERSQLVYEFLVPVVKGWSTEMSLEATSLGVQVHGGMGFIEETGAAQYYRDARILTIYEGTTAIQANDLVGRKSVRDGGATIKHLIDLMSETQAELAGSDQESLLAIGRQLKAGISALSSVVDYVVGVSQSDPHAAYAGSVPYLKMCGIILSGWQLARSALIAQRLSGEAGADSEFLSAKISTARFFADHLLPLGVAMENSIVAGAAATLAIEPAQL